MKLKSKVALIVLILTTTTVLGGNSEIEILFRLEIITDCHQFVIPGIPSKRAAGQGENEW